MGNHFFCRCGTKKTPRRLCPHCDHPCPIGPKSGCRPCVAIETQWDAAKAVMATRPHPDGPLPAGATISGVAGRCEHCGGPTYTLDGVPWCPRAFCWTADGPEAD